MFILVVLGGTALPTGAPIAADAPALTAGPGIPFDDDELMPPFVIEDMAREIGPELDDMLDALERDEFESGRPIHRQRTLDLLDELDELERRSSSVTFGEFNSFLDEFEVLYVELYGELFVPSDLRTGGPDAATPTAPTTASATTIPAATIAETVPPTTAVPAAPATTIAEIAPTTAAAEGPVTETATAPTTPRTPVDLPSTAPPAGSISTDRLVSILLGVLGLTALLAVAAYLFDRWRRRRLPTPAGRPGFHDLLDVSRRLAAAGTIDEVEILSVRQAMRLTDADAGAFVRRGDRVASVTFETSDDLLVPDRLNEGALDRVLATGHELIQTTSVEPAIRQVPVSLLAMPVFNDGAVFGAIVLLRDAEHPFGTHEGRMASDLKSIVGAAIEHAEHTEQMRAEALADGLTGVRNRRALDLDVADLADRRFSAVMVDLDHFKQVNDTHGHQAGDELLHAVAQRILANVRPIDEVYRYGGEEFAIVMPDTETATAGDIADRVRVALASAPFTIGPERTVHQATASLGVATGADGQSVFARADEALYAAKHGGRNRVVVATSATPSAMPPPSVDDAVAQPSI